LLKYAESLHIMATLRNFLGRFWITARIWRGPSRMCDLPPPDLSASDLRSDGSLYPALNHAGQLARSGMGISDTNRKAAL
jgi:hypothetical protein